MNVSFDEVAISERELEKCPVFCVRTKESGVLIGVKGANLAALNHLVKKMASRGSPENEDIKLIVDVNDYHDKMLQDLKAKAMIMSERARSFGVDVPLPPMSSYERMIIHSLLEGAPNIKTESEGQGKDRRVVIKYIKGE